MRRTWRTVSPRRRAASAWVRSPRRTGAITLRMSRSRWLMGVRSLTNRSVGIGPPCLEQRGHFYLAVAGHFYFGLTGGKWPLVEPGDLPERRAEAFLVALAGV